MPGAVDAYLTLLETFGRRTIVEVLAPALGYAEQGFPMYEYMHRMLSVRETRTQFALYPPGGEAVFYPDRHPPRVGERFRQPALAATLKKLVAAGAQSGGDRLTGIGSERRPGIVHRLDKDTSGLMVVAKTQLANTALTAAFAARDIDRAYLAHHRKRFGFR